MCAWFYFWCMVFLLVKYIQLEHNILSYLSFLFLTDWFENDARLYACMFLGLLYYIWINLCMRALFTLPNSLKQVFFWILDVRYIDWHICSRFFFSKPDWFSVISVWLWDPRYNSARVIVCAYVWMKSKFFDWLKWNERERERESKTKQNRLI